jgi:general secretion pathway protein L
MLGDVQIYVTQSFYAEQESEIEGLREFVPGIQVKLLPEGPLPLFALQAVGGSAVNLLSGPYERKSSFAVSFARWRYVAALFVVATVMHFTYNGMKLWQSIRVERELDKQIRELVVQTLPGTTLKDTRDARRQVEARLTALQQTGSGGDLLGGLATLGEALAEAPDTHVEALSYRLKTIDLRVTAPSVDALDKIEQAANAAGMNAHIQSATPRDDKVEGRLQLKVGA